MKKYLSISGFVLGVLLAAMPAAANPLLGKWFNFYDLKKERLKYGYEIAEFKEDIAFFYGNGRNSLRTIAYRSNGQGIDIKIGKDGNWETIKFIEDNAFLWGNTIYTRFIGHKSPVEIFLARTKLQLHYYRKKMLHDFDRAFYHVNASFPDLAQQLKQTFVNSELLFSAILSIFDHYTWGNDNERSKLRRHVMESGKLFEDINYLFENMALLNNTEVIYQKDNLWILKFPVKGITYYVPVSFKYKHNIYEYVYYFPAKDLEHAKKQLEIIKAYLVAKQIY